jgi:hypothetical protein
MSVFVSYSSRDNERVLKFATDLRGRGVNVWLDEWELRAGDSVVTELSNALDKAEAAVVLFSQHHDNSPWMKAELEYLLWARVAEQKRIIPVVLDHHVKLPALIRPLARRHIDDLDGIVDAILNRPPAKPQLGTLVTHPRHRVTIALNDVPVGGVQAVVTMGAAVFEGPVVSELPKSLVKRVTEFRGGPRGALLRDAANISLAQARREQGELARELSALCLPVESDQALASLIDGAPLGATIEVVCQATSPRLLGLPFELLQLPNGSRIALQPNVDFWRTPGGTQPGSFQAADALPHPLKLLVAVGAPDEEKTNAGVLDYEQELQNLLDAVDNAQRDGRCEVRFLEVGGPKFIQQGLQDDDYHVLHLSCHGNAGLLELENEEGDPVLTTPETLLQHLRGANKRVPLVFLNACHTAVGSEQTAGFALSLLRAGVPAVVAMQAAVSDQYATELAKAFYENLSKQELASPSRALAAARRAVEAERRAAEGRGAAPAWPEQATATLYVAGEDQPLVNYGGTAQPLKRPPVHTPEGVVPGLSVGDLIGRRKPLRSVLKSLRDPKGLPGVLVRGIGGVGKSALTGRVMQRCREDGWYVAAVKGPLSIDTIAESVAEALGRPGNRAAQKDDKGTRTLDAATVDLLNRLNDRNAREDQRVKWIEEALRTQKLLLVLDDFEQNLEVGGERLLSLGTGGVLEAWTTSHGHRLGRLLLTCRHPLQGVAGLEGVAGRFRDVPLDPLSGSETRKLLQRLPALRGGTSEEQFQILRTVGGHPRMLEFVNALLTPTEGEVTDEALARRERVWGQMCKLAPEAKVDLGAGDGGRLTGDEATSRAIRLGMRNIFLKELVGLAKRAGDAEVLFQTAVSNVPVSAAGVTQMLNWKDPAKARKEGLRTKSGCPSQLAAIGAALADHPTVQ